MDLSTIWGLDFGTTTTFLSRSDFGIVRTVNLNPLGATEHLPSVLALDGQRILVGEDAQNSASTMKFVSVKRAISENSEKVIASDGTQWSADDAIRAVLSKVYSIAFQDVGATPIRLGCPAMWDGKQRARLLRLAAEAGFKVTFDTLVEEPVAACIAWFKSRMSEGIFPAGKTLIFDMGGGTLDVAVLMLSENEILEPEISVLASGGNDFAGDRIDQEIYNYLVMREISGSARHVALEGNPGAGLELASSLKELLSSSNVAKLNLQIDQGELYSLTHIELKDCAEGVFKEAKKLLEATLYQAKVPENQGNSISRRELMERFTFIDLADEIDNVVVVGGMAKMPVLLDYLNEMGITPRVAESGSSATSFNAVSSVSQGLSVGEDYDRLSLDRPGFNFELRWRDKGCMRSQIIYSAYDKFYPEYFEWTRSLDLIWTNENLEPSDSDTGYAVLCASTITGTDLEFVLDGQAMKHMGPGFQFGTSVSYPRVIKIQPDGRVFIRDGHGFEYVLKVERWPVVDRPSSYVLHTLNPDAAYGIRGLPWHLKP